MKKLFYIFIAVSFLGCEKDPFKIVYGPSGGVGDQKVLIEELTGVNCTNCPAAHDELASLASLNQGNIILVSIHSGFFSPPYTGKSKLDFRTQEGDDLNEYLGHALSFPTACINRTNFPPATMLFNDQASWSGDIQQLRNQPAKAGLAIETLYDKPTRILRIKLSGIAKEDFKEELLAHVMITESNIIDWQKDGRVTTPIVGENYNYVHKHVLRDIVTSVTGDEFVHHPFKGQSFVKEYSITLPDFWIAENCNVVGFISYSSKKGVIQVNEAKVVQ